MLKFCLYNVGYQSISFGFGTHIARYAHASTLKSDTGTAPIRINRLWALQILYTV